MKKRVRVANNLQKNYAYICTAAPGKQFDPEFCPELTPAQMLQLGVFGGHYMETTAWKEFPASWLKGAKISPRHKEKEFNYFQVRASQPLQVWREKGWIYKDDPYGWFQWYCRYYVGRRIPEEDQRQIKRWKAIKRHLTQIKKHCKKGDMQCRRKQRQALLHWAYDTIKI